ncbi:M18 family aminopeptidase [Marinilabilia rubra]|uniref:M18 family aminopeptidase n=1 Tax=Marinilabilia rubra TaxID=2162893 RepID=A0A2U2BC84_9BACT|nr:M18 family aminopeptidase [Marinilabilia rubra]PWE00643.1 M18 family aminopeptidase [Marinilabilia rubra]
MEKELKLATELIDFIHTGASPFHVVQNTAKILKQAGFKELDLTEKWELQKGQKYYTTRNESSIFAFITGTESPKNNGVKMICAHSDSPSFKIKPDPEISPEDYFVKFNTEVYGGPILMSWLDRPLSMAGRISLDTGDPLRPESRLVNFNRPMLVIPNLAIHLNREVNEGVALNKQTDMLPLSGILGEGSQSKGYFKELLAMEAGVESEKIVDFDITLNEQTRGCILGAHQEFISSPKLDDLAMVHAGLEALINSEPSESTKMLCIFDNEEVGSQTKQGAGSPVFKNLFYRILRQLGTDDEGIQQTIYKSFMISADMAHSVHPNQPDKHDPVLHPLINKGPVIKIHANQKYTTDGESGAIFELLCKSAGVPCQKFVNRSDMAGGSTLGNVSTTQLDVRSVDIGNPMLAMHSVRELGGVKDHEYVIRVFNKFFELEKQ